MASAPSSSISVIGRRVWPNSDSRGGRSSAPCRSRSSVSACRTWGGGAPIRSASGLPQLRLPGEVVVEPTADAVGRVVVEPVDEQLRTLDGVRREEAGDPPRDRVAAAPAQLGLVALVEVPEMGRQGAAPVFVETLRR